MNLSSSYRVFNTFNLKGKQRNRVVCDKAILFSDTSRDSNQNDSLEIQLETDFRNLNVKKDNKKNKEKQHRNIKPKRNTAKLTRKLILQNIVNTSNSDDSKQNDYDYLEEKKKNLKSEKKKTKKNKSTNDVANNIKDVKINFSDFDDYSLCIEEVNTSKNEISCLPQQHVYNEIHIESDEPIIETCRKHVTCSTSTPLTEQKNMPKRGNVNLSAIGLQNDKHDNIFSKSIEKNDYSCDIDFNHTSKSVLDPSDCLFSSTDFYKPLNDDEELTKSEFKIKQFYESYNTVNKSNELEIKPKSSRNLMQIYAIEESVDYENVSQLSDVIPSDACSDYESDIKNLAEEENSNCIHSSFSKHENNAVTVEYREEILNRDITGNQKLSSVISDDVENSNDFKSALSGLLSNVKSNSVDNENFEDIEEYNNDNNDDYNDYGDDDISNESSNLPENSCHDSENISFQENSTSDAESSNQEVEENNDYDLCSFSNESDDLQQDFVSSGKKSNYNTKAADQDLNFKVPNNDKYLTPRLSKQLRRLTLRRLTDCRQSLLTVCDVFSPMKTPKGVHLTSKDKLLICCNQKRVMKFEESLTKRMLNNVKKIGEGVYGEVFLAPRGKTKSAIKIIPVEGQTKINGEIPKSFLDICAEIIISRELSNLCDVNNENFTPGFCPLKKASLVQGEYPQSIKEQWHIYDEENISENDCPDDFPLDQYYVLLEYEECGKTVESLEFKNASQAYSILLQTTLSLAVAENRLEFEHRDLHWGNVLVKDERRKFIQFKLNGEYINIETYGVKVTIIDYTMARLTEDGKNIFTNLANDEDLFTGEGDVQFDIYRMMRKENDNNWEFFTPKTNVFWLYYLCYKLCHHTKFNNNKDMEHTSFKKKLTNILHNISNCSSAVVAYNNCFC